MSSYYISAIDDGSGNYTILVQRAGTRPSGGTQLSIPHIDNLNAPSQATISGATNAAPIVVATSAAHGFSVNDEVTIAGVLGNTAANGTWTISVVGDSTHFTILNSTGNGAYTSGGVATKLGTTKMLMGALQVAARAALNDRAAGN